MIGRSRHELLGSTSIDLAPEADRKRLATKVYYLPDGGELLTATSLSAANGEMVPIELSARRIDDSTSGETFFLAILRDLRTRQAEEQARLRREEQQRSAIVREIHHRIKNHLQALLGLIAREATRNPTGAHLFRDISTKINSIAVVHGLQASHQRDAINLCDLVTTVSALIEDIHGTPGRMRTSVDIEEPALIRETEGVPVALLMNEAIGNAAKHSPSQDDVITITLTGAGRDAQATVSIRNPGFLPGGFDHTSFSSISSGLGLIEALLPANGARFSIHQDSQRGEVVTLIHLESPVLIKRGPNS